MTSELPDITQEHLNKMTSGVWPNERPTSVEVFTENLRKTVQALGLAHNMDVEYNNAITDVLEVLDDDT